MRRRQALRLAVAVVLAIMLGLAVLTFVAWPSKSSQPVTVGQVISAFRAQGVTLDKLDAPSYLGLRSETQHRTLLIEVRLDDNSAKKERARLEAGEAVRKGIGKGQPSCVLRARNVVTIVHCSRTTLLSRSTRAMESISAS